MTNIRTTNKQLQFLKRSTQSLQLLMHNQRQPTETQTRSVQICILITCSIFQYQSKGTTNGPLWHVKYRKFNNNHPLDAQLDKDKMVTKQGSSNSAHMQVTHDSNMTSLAEFWTKHLNYWNLNYRLASKTWSMSYPKMTFS